MLEEPAKYHDAIADIKTKCKCGHTKVIPVYRTPKLEFEYKLREEMKKNDNK